MPRLFTSSSDNLVAASSVVSGRPAWLSIWVKRHAANSFGGMYAALYAASNQMIAIGEDVTGSSGKPVVYIAAGAYTGEVKAATAVVADTWTHAAASASSTEMDAWINGAGKGSAIGGNSPSTLTAMRVNNILTSLSSISMAGFAVGNTLLADVEAAALGAGLDPRHIASCTNFYLINTASGTEADLVGTIGMTITGTSAASDAPPVSTFMTGGPVGAQSWVVGTAITSINLAAGGGVFADTASPFTVTLQQLTATATTGTTNGSGSTVRIIALSAAMSSLAAGDYITIGAGSLTRVLAVSAAGTTVLVSSNQSYAASSTVTRYSVAPLSIAGISITSNVVSGTPTAAATYANCVWRATCNAGSTAIADSDVASITIASSGGGGGGTALQQAALAFTGGFQGS